MAKELTKQAREQIVERLLDSFQNIYKDALAVAEEYVEAIDADEIIKLDLIEGAAKRNFRLSIRTLNWFERVGRHEVHWKLMPGIGEAHSTQIRRLPYSDQKAIFDDGKKYPLLLDTGDHIMVDVRQISKAQADQIFGDGYIRDLPEQKTYLLENPSGSEGLTEVKDPYRITARGLEIAGYVFTKAKLREILLQM